jgi:hypothetical protein
MITVAGVLYGLPGEKNGSDGEGEGEEGKEGRKGGGGGGGRGGEGGPYPTHCQQLLSLSSLFLVNSPTTVNISVIFYYTCFILALQVLSNEMDPAKVRFFRKDRGAKVFIKICLSPIM